MAARLLFSVLILASLLGSYAMAVGDLPVGFGIILSGSTLLLAAGVLVVSLRQETWSAQPAESATAEAPAPPPHRRTRQAA